MRLFLAFRSFFAVLFRRDAADRIRICLENKVSEPIVEKLPEKPSSPAPVAAPKSKPSPRSEALTLLSTLQREARLLDLVGESLDQYADAQIGAAARDVLRDTKKTLDRMFGLKHLVEAEEGSMVEIPNQPSPVRWRIVGKESQTRGSLSHPGWQASRLDLPQWSGGADDALVIAAAEVET
jgi:hypothetical protein